MGQMRTSIQNGSTGTLITSVNNQIKITTKLWNNHHSTVKNQIEWKYELYGIKEKTSIQTEPQN